MFTQYVLLLTSLLSSVLTLPLVERDVVDPPITSPTASTIWHVGQTQTVTWNATNLPVNQTNPIGMLVLGYLIGINEHLMIDSPLATNINYSVAQAQITVPNVPTRSNYIVVLFGDSGNASPEFTIINDASSSAPVSSPGPTSLPSSTPTATSPPTSPSPSPSPPTDSTSPPANPSPTGSGQPPASATTPPVTATAPSGTSTTSHLPSTTSTVVVTSSSTPTSAGWQNHVPSLGTSLSVALGVVYFVFS